MYLVIAMKCQLPTCKAYSCLSCDKLHVLTATEQTCAVCPRLQECTIPARTSAITISARNAMPLDAAVPNVMLHIDFDHKLPVQLSAVSWTCSEQSTGMLSPVSQTVRGTRAWCCRSWWAVHYSARATAPMDPLRHLSGRPISAALLAVDIFLLPFQLCVCGLFCPGLGRDMHWGSCVCACYNG